MMIIMIHLRSKEKKSENDNEDNHDDYDEDEDHHIKKEKDPKLENNPETNTKSVHDATIVEEDLEVDSDDEFEDHLEEFFGKDQIDEQKTSFEEDGYHGEDKHDDHVSVAKTETDQPEESPQAFPFDFNDNDYDYFTTQTRQKNHMEN